MKQKAPIAILCGRGSRLPAIISATKKKSSNFYISLVVSHRKPQEGESDVPGIALARKENIPAVYWNLIQMTNILGRGDDYRKAYEENLAAFINQSYYKPQFIFMTGWMLILSKNFLKHFPLNDYSRVINIHPFWLPDINENQEEITLPSGMKAPALRGPGDEVIKKTLELGLTYTGVTTYFLVPGAYDAGPVIKREWVGIAPGETPESLRIKLNEVEDRQGPLVLELLAQGKLKIENGKVKILHSSR
jgi:folate-dependent phosphoribosylglycinamide formyltransferase PurN